MAGRNGLVTGRLPQSGVGRVQTSRFGSRLNPASGGGSPACWAVNAPAATPLSGSDLLQEGEHVEVVAALLQLPVVVVEHEGGRSRLVLPGRRDRSLRSRHL